MKQQYLSRDGMIDALQSRGLEIDRKAAKEILTFENYYNIVNGYKSLFIDHSATREKFLSGTNFNELYSLYLFDKDLRNLFLKFILEIESNFKCVVSHIFTSKHKHNYLAPYSFDRTLNKIDASSHNLNMNFYNICKLIEDMQTIINNHVFKNDDCFCHHNEKYGFIPLWVLVNKMTFRDISIFYKYMYFSEKDMVAKTFKLQPFHLQSYIDNLRLFRNVCAHGERFYNKKIFNSNKKPRRIRLSRIHLELGLIASEDSSWGRNDLFSLLICLKLMLRPIDFTIFFDALEFLINRLSTSLKTVNIESVIKLMGFPENWKQIKSI